jgi:predicted ArsR family transcriptional regulator
MDRKPMVLAFLKAREEASLGEVAARLGVTKQGALRHLEALLGAGLISVTQEGHPGPGRPEHHYRLTPAANELFPHSHRQLASDLVAFMGPRQLERFFKARAVRMEAQYRSRLADRSFSEKVRELGRAATDQGHMTEVTESKGSWQLRHCNCPIQDIASRTSHPCQQEQAMYERLLGARVERSTWLGQGDSSCTYDISNSNREDVNG